MDALKLLALLRTTNAATEDAREINTAVKQDIRQAVVEYNLNPRAFSMCVSISRMDQVKRIALLRAFDQYRAMLQLDNEAQGELLPDPPTQLNRASHG